MKRQRIERLLVALLLKNGGVMNFMAISPRCVGATIEAEVRAVHKTAIDFYRAITKEAR